VGDLRTLTNITVIAATRHDLLTDLRFNGNRAAANSRPPTAYWPSAVDERTAGGQRLRAIRCSDMIVDGSCTEPAPTEDHRERAHDRTDFGGRRTALLLLGPSLVLRAHAVGTAARQLAGRFRVIAWDLPGTAAHHRR